MKAKLSKLIPITKSWADAANAYELTHGTVNNFKFEKLISGAAGKSFNPSPNNVDGWDGGDFTCNLISSFFLSCADPVAKIGVGINIASAPAMTKGKMFCISLDLDATTEKFCNADWAYPEESMQGGFFTPDGKNVVLRAYEMK